MLCVNCGRELEERGCKVRCGNCGYFEDCSDPSAPGEWSGSAMRIESGTRRHDPPTRGEDSGKKL